MRKLGALARGWRRRRCHSRLERHSRVKFFGRVHCVDDALAIFHPNYVPPQELILWNDFVQQLNVPTRVALERQA